jgi:hypothetical protein
MGLTIVRHDKAYGKRQLVNWSIIHAIDIYSSFQTLLFHTMELSPGTGTVTLFEKYKSCNPEAIDHSIIV